MEEVKKKPVRIRKVQKVPEISVLPEDNKEELINEKSDEKEKERRAGFTEETLKSIRDLFLNPVNYMLPDEMKTVWKGIIRNLAEARKKLQQRIPERITLNDMLLSSFNTLLNQVQRSELTAGEGERFPDERDAAWFIVQFEQCKMLAALTDLPVGGEGITYDMADITFFLSNTIDLESKNEDRKN